MLERIILATTLAGTVLAGGCANKPFDREAWLHKKQEYSRLDNDELFEKIRPQTTISVSDAHSDIAVFGSGGFQMNIMPDIANAMKKLEMTQLADWGNYPKYMDDILIHHKLGHDIVLLGHSMGCSDVKEVAIHLGDADIPAMLVYLDDFPSVSNIPFFTNHRKIPKNVHTVLNIYTNDTFHGAPLTHKHCESPQTIIYNVFHDVGHMFYDRRGITRMIEAMTVELVQNNRGRSGSSSYVTFSLDGEDVSVSAAAQYKEATFTHFKGLKIPQTTAAAD